MDIEKIDNELLNILQSDFPLTDRPFSDLGEMLSISEEEVITRIKKLKNIKFSFELSCDDLIKDFNGADIDTMLNLGVQFSEKLTLDYNHVKRATDEIKKRKN